jgi:peptide/nickel transport system permease protein
VPAEPVTGHVTRRLLGAVPLLVGIATLIFVVLHLAPGDPTATLFGPDVPPEVIDQATRTWGLDQPLHVQYFKWLGAAFTGDFGVSYIQSRPVIEIILDALPYTLAITLSTLVLVFVFGVLLGVYQGVRQYSAADNVLSVLALFFYSMPSFWLGLMLALIFAQKAHQWGWPITFPVSGPRSVDYELLSLGGRIVDRLRHLALPVTTLTLALTAGVSRYTRSQMLEVVRQDYIRTARAKGLPERDVILRHALRNSLIPVITLLGLYLPFLFSGTVFVEHIFAWPGMGRVIVNAIQQRDYPVIMATSFFFSVLVVVGNLVADVLYAWADPRIRHD